MRYYDLVETPQTGKTFLEDGENRIPASDSRVEVYFQSIDKVKYDRAFDGEGYPILKEYALQEDGTRYQFYLVEPDEEGVYQPDMVAIGEATMIATAQEAVNYITALVQARIDQYNKDHNLAFTGIEGMAKYTRRPEYSHLQFANDVLDWNEDVWEEANLIKAQVLSGEISQPTPQEFASMLPEYTGVI